MSTRFGTNLIHIEPMLDLMCIFHFFFLLYPHQTKFEEGIRISMQSVGPLQILHIELLPHFLSNAHEIWHTHWSCGEDVQDIFFKCVVRCVAMVMHIMAINQVTVLPERYESNKKVDYYDVCFYFLRVLNERLLKEQELRYLAENSTIVQHHFNYSMKHRCNHPTVIDVSHQIPNLGLLGPLIA